MYVSIDLSPADFLDGFGVHSIGDGPEFKPADSAWIELGPRLYSRLTAAECERIAARFTGLALRIDELTFARDAVAEAERRLDEANDLLDRAFGDGTCPADPDGMHSSDCGHDVEDGRDVESASYQAAAS